MLQVQKPFIDVDHQSMKMYLVWGKLEKGIEETKTKNYVEYKKCTIKAIWVVTK